MRLRIAVSVDRTTVEGTATIPNSSSWFVDSIFYIQRCTDGGCAAPAPTTPETVPFRTLHSTTEPGVRYRMCARWTTTGGYSVPAPLCGALVTG